MVPEQRLGDQGAFSQLFEAATDRPSLALMALGPSDGSDRAGLSVVLTPSADKSADKNQSKANQSKALLRARFSRSMLQAMLQQLSGRN
ncbi:MAG TPA: hypothetical protein VL137_14895 [Polyangiaceae bacterium]|nr:hypothetical protein [Polyangiaceae bacterium]